MAGKEGMPSDPQQGQPEHLRKAGVVSTSILASGPGTAPITAGDLSVEVASWGGGPGYQDLIILPSLVCPLHPHAHKMLMVLLAPGPEERDRRPDGEDRALWGLSPPLTSHRSEPSTMPHPYVQSLRVAREKEGTWGAGQHPQSTASQHSYLPISSYLCPAKGPQMEGGVLASPAFLLALEEWIRIFWQFSRKQDGDGLCHHGSGQGSYRSRLGTVQQAGKHIEEA